MLAVVQRVKSCEILIDHSATEAIGPGFFVLLGVVSGDTEKQAKLLAEKVAHLRVFDDDAGKMGRSLFDVSGEMAVVSNFTLAGDMKKGRRPDFLRAAKPPEAVPLYELFVKTVKDAGLPVKTGKFGADMQITLINDGPVTLILDTDKL